LCREIAAVCDTFWAAAFCEAVVVKAESVDASSWRRCSAECEYNVSFTASRLAGDGLFAMQMT